MKDKIIDVVGELIAEYGMKKFTMDEVSKRLGMSKKTLYKIFTSKQELITEYFQKVYENDIRITQAILADASKTLREKLYLVVETYDIPAITAQVIEEAEQNFPIQDKQFDLILKTKVDVIAQLITEAYEAGEVRTTHTKEVIVLIVDQWSQLITSSAFLKKNPNISIREIGVISVDIILNGCLVQN